MRRQRGVTLHDETELHLAAPTLIDVEAVVADIPDADVLQVDSASPNFNAVVNIVHDFHVIDDRFATNSTE